METTRARDSWTRGGERPIESPATQVGGPAQSPDRRLLLVCCLTFIVALAVRLPGIGERSFWLDETETIADIRESGVEGVLARVGAVEGGKGPLYFLALKGWAAVFGESEVSLRTPSAILGSLACVLAVLWIAALCRQLPMLRDRAEEGTVHALMPSVIAGIVTALHPTLVVLSREARTYSFSQFFLVGAALLAVPAYLGPKNRWTTVARIACPAIGAIGASAHVLSTLFLGGVFLATGVLLVARRQSLAPLLAGAAGFVAIMLSQIPLTVGHVNAHYGGGGAPPTIGVRDLAHFAIEVCGGKPGVVAIVLLAGLATTRGRGDPIVRFGIVAWVSSAAAALCAHYFVLPLLMGGARYLAWQVFLLPLVLSGLTRLRRPLLPVSLVVLVAALLASLATRRSFDARHAEDWRSAAVAAQAESRSGDEVICHQSYVSRPFVHYYRGEAIVRAYRANGDQADPGSSLDLARRVLSRGGRVLLVWSHAEPWESRRAEFEAALGPAEVVHEQYAIRVLRFGR